MLQDEEQLPSLSEVHMHLTSRVEKNQSQLPEVNRKLERIELMLEYLCGGSQRTTNTFSRLLSFGPSTPTTRRRYSDDDADA